MPYLHFSYPSFALLVHPLLSFVPSKEQEKESGKNTMNKWQAKPVIRANSDVYPPTIEYSLSRRMYVLIDVTNQNIIIQRQ